MLTSRLKTKTGFYIGKYLLFTLFFYIQMANEKYVYRYPKQTESRFLTRNIFVV